MWPMHRFLIAEIGIFLSPPGSIMALKLPLYRLYTAVHSSTYNRTKSENCLPRLKVATALASWLWWRGHLRILMLLALENAKTLLLLRQTTEINSGLHQQTPKQCVVDRPWLHQLLKDLRGRKGEHFAHYQILYTRPISDCPIWTPDIL
jgi:hypothetical protein